MSQIRVHVNFGDQRTTISVDRVLFELMAFNLGYMPDDPAALAAIRSWIGERLPAKVGTRGGPLKQASQGARVLLVEAIADKEISTQRDAWLADMD